MEFFDFYYIFFIGVLTKCFLQIISPIFIHEKLICFHTILALIVLIIKDQRTLKLCMFVCLFSLGVSSALIAVNVDNLHHDLLL